MKNEKEKIKKLIETLVEQELKEGAFLDPLLDPFKTAVYGIKKLGTSFGVNTLKLLGQTLTVMIPFISHKEVTKIGQRAFSKRKELISKLDNQYKDVLDRNLNAFSNADVGAVLMLTNPGAYLSAKVGLTGTTAALSALELLVSPFPILSQQVSDLKNKVSKINTTSTGWQGASGGSSGGGGGMGGSDYGYADAGDGGGLYEALPAVQAQTAAIDKEILNLLQDPQIKNAVKNSDLTKQLDRISLNTVVDRVNELNKIKNIKDLKSFMDKETFNKLQLEINKSMPKDLKDQNRIEEYLLNQTKTLYRKIYIDSLNKQKINSSIPDEIDAAIKNLQQ